MKISIDVEGTLADPSTPWVNRYNSLYGTNLSVKDINEWNFENSKFGISWKTFIDQMTDLWKNDWKSIPPTESNLPEMVDELGKKYQIHIVTARKISEKEIRSWLDLQVIIYDNFLAVGYTDHSSRKSEIDFDVFIDDSTKLASEITEKKKGRML